MPKVEVNLNVDVIDRLIPHSDPFLFVDKVIEISDDCTYIKAQKKLTGEEDFFRGHFPTKKIFPGIMIIEGLGQSFAILGSLKRFLRQGNNIEDLHKITDNTGNAKPEKEDNIKNNLVYLIKADVKFIKLVEAGETITYNVKQKSLDSQKLKK